MELKRAVVRNQQAWFVFNVRDTFDIGDKVSIGCSLDQTDLLQACVQQFTIGRHISLTDYIFSADRRESILPGATVGHFPADAEVELCYPLKRQFHTPVQFRSGHSAVAVPDYDGLAFFIT